MLRVRFSAWIWLILSLTATAQPTATTTLVPIAADPLGRDTPQSSVISFLEACRTQNFTQAAMYLDLRGHRGNNGPLLAKELGQLLDRDVDFDAGSLSRNAQGDATGGGEIVATFTDEGRTSELFLDRVELRPNTFVWQFSTDTVSLIPQLYKLVGESAFEARLPQTFVRWMFLDTSLWRWLAMGLLAVLLIAVSSILSRGLLRLARPLLRRVSAYLHTAQLEELVGPTRLLVSVALFRAGLEFIGPSALLRLYVFRLLSLLFMIGLAWMGMRLMDVATDRMQFGLAASHDNLSSSILLLGSKIMKIVIFAVAFAAILGNWGYSTTTMLAGVGVGGLAVALAAQKTLENLFGGVAVISDRPVLVGDICRFGDRTGTVEDIGLRSTRIRTLDRTLVTVPNAQFSSMTLENLSRRDRIWFHPRLSLAREATPVQIRELLASISRSLNAHPKVDSATNSVFFAAVGVYSFDLDVSAYVLTSNDTEFSGIQQELLLLILEAIAGVGASLAIPTSNVTDTRTPAIRTTARTVHPEPPVARATHVP